MEPQYDNRDFEGRVVEGQKNVKNWPWEEWYDDRTYTNSDGEVVRAYEDGARHDHYSHGSARRWSS